MFLLQVLLRAFTEILLKYYLKHYIYVSQILYSRSMETANNQTKRISDLFPHKTHKNIRNTTVNLYKERTNCQYKSNYGINHSNTAVKYGVNNACIVLNVF